MVIMQVLYTQFPVYLLDILGSITLWNITSNIVFVNNTL